MVALTESRSVAQLHGDGVAPPFYHSHFYEMSNHFADTAPRSPRFGSLRRRKRIEYFEDTSEGSDGRTSSDEYESNGSSKKIDDNNNDRTTQQPHRKTSHFAFSNVKKKITSTFQRRHSVAMHPPSPPRTPTNGKPLLLRRSSTANSPRMVRQKSLDDNHGIHQNRKSSLRRHVTMAAVRLHDQSQVGSGSNPSLDRILQKSQFQRESSSSTPNIQAHARDQSSKMKTFNIHILGSKSVGKTALTVRFLTGRYIHEYKSAPEESYTRIVKYEDEQVNVRIFINDVENMERDIKLDQNSGIMILYSIVDRTSYTHAKTILHCLAQSSITGFYPVMLLGTKRELSRMRQVDRKESFRTATQYSCTQFDVSSASNRRVTDSFHTLFRQIEIRQILRQEDDKEIPTIVNPPLVIRCGTVRYGTAP